MRKILFLVPVFILGCSSGGTNSSSSLLCDSGGTPFGGGDGSTSNPYLICSANQLNSVSAAIVPGQTPLNFQLTSDVDMSNVTWKGTISFITGTFDGNNHTISNLNSSSGGQPVINFLQGTIKNLNLVNLTAKSFIGSSSNGSFINAVSISGGVVNTTGDNVGCLIGSNSSNISNCSASCQVTSSNGQYVGGLVGFNLNGNISNSNSSGTVTGSSYVGGLVGVLNGGTTTKSSSSSNVTGSNNVGGFVGATAFTLNTVSNCFATGAVHDSSGGSGTYFGGLVGYNNSTISASYSRGTVTSSCVATGGLVGNNHYAILNSFSSSPVVSAGSSFGGLVGTSSGTITTSFSTGAVSVNGGGLVGTNTGTVTSSYWDNQSSGRNTSAGGTGATTTNMQSLSGGGFVSWDFISVWNPPSGSYPSLR